MKWTDIPIIINSKDRKSCLEALLQRLDQDKLMDQVTVLDTGSTYPPMVEFLKQLRCRVIQLEPKRTPHHAVWELGLTDKWKECCASGEGWFVYTDCDVVPDCPAGWLEPFFEALKCHTAYPKLGFSLRIDDLPDHYALKQSVVQWESQFWQSKLNSAWYIAPIDTTLALYRPGAPSWCVGLRSAPPYVAKHLPWYYDSSNPTEEWIYYLKHMHPGVGHWSAADRSTLKA